MLGWFELTILSTLLFGIQNFLYKVSAAKKQNSHTVTLASTITVAVASVIFFFVTKGKIIELNFLLFVSFLCAIFTVVNSITKIEGLKFIPTSIFYPIIKASIALTLIASIFIFGEVLGLKQWIGIFFIVVVVILLSIQDKSEKIKNLKIGLFFAFGCALANTLYNIVSKFAVERVDYNNFLGGMYIFSIFFTLTSMRIFEKKEKTKNTKGSLMIGFIIGLFIFTGFLLGLKALVSGPLGIITAINSLSLIIPIILGALIYKEKVTFKRVLAVSLAIIAVILLK